MSRESIGNRVERSGNELSKHEGAEGYCRGTSFRVFPRPLADLTHVFLQPLFCAYDGPPAIPPPRDVLIPANPSRSIFSLPHLHTASSLRSHLLVVSITVGWRLSPPSLPFAYPPNLSSTTSSSPSFLLRCRPPSFSPVAVLYIGPRQSSTTVRRAGGCSAGRRDGLPVVPTACEGERARPHRKSMDGRLSDETLVVVGTCAASSERCVALQRRDVSAEQCVEKNSLSSPVLLVLVPAEHGCGGRGGACRTAPLDVEALH